MRPNILLSCLLIGVSLATVPQAILNLSPSDATTQTVTVTPAFTATDQNGQRLYCGVGTVAVTYTGEVHIDFQAVAPVDFYIVSWSQWSKNWVLSPCILPGPFVFAMGNAYSGHFNVNLPAEPHIIVLVQCCKSQLNYVTIVLNSTSVSVSITPTTSAIASTQPTTIPYTLTSSSRNPSTRSQGQTFIPNIPLDQLYAGVAALFAILFIGTLAFLIRIRERQTKKKR